jgi:hypothetical protein
MESSTSTVFVRRLKLYVVGLALGLVLSYALFGDRYPTWLPGSRVMDDLNRLELNYAPASECALSCANISRESIQELLDNGEVNFDESKTRGETHPSYAIEGTTKDGRSLRVFFLKRDSTYEVTGGFDLKDKGDCDCD